MGIVNVTPDSFYDGGRCFDRVKAVEHALALLEEGADLLDIGGESTRPGASPVSVDEEIARVLPVIEGVRRHSAAPISIDTRNAPTAEAALDAGADIVNDISALRHDPAMTALVARRGVPVVLMHMRGTPETMQIDVWYDDPVAEIRRFLEERVSAARQAGVVDVIVDPGIGFGKRVSDNLALLRGLDELTLLGCPLLIGVSRKSFLGRITGRNTRDRLAETLAACVIAALNGATILRVHDVREVRAAVAIAEAVREGRVEGAD
ncbi:MAG: dihydropteroate synthase [Bacteroidota bacterium]|nr:dihydropteroate synthase [Bacteroidota bacterium]